MRKLMVALAAAGLSFFALPALAASRDRPRPAAAHPKRPAKVANSAKSAKHGKARKVVRAGGCYPASLEGV